MLIGIFKSTQPIALFAILPVFTLLLWLFGFIHPVTIPVDHVMPFFEVPANILKSFPLISILIALLFTYFQGLLINDIVIRNEILPQRTNLVALMYVLLMSCFDSFLTLHPALFSNLFLLLALNQVGALYRKEIVFSQVFKAGAFIAIASLFYFPSLVLFLFIWTSLLIIRPFAWREYVISLIGLIIPYAFVIVYYYWWDMLHFLWHDKMFNPISERSLNLPGQGFSNYLLIGFLGLLLIMSFSRLLNTLNKTVVRTQNLLWVLLTFLLFSIVAIILFGNTSMYVYGFTAIPVSVFFANYFLSQKKSWISEALFLALLVIIVYHHVND